jgi:hypothetical protein
MKDDTSGKSNPVTKEIEVKGMVSFVKTYFKKLQEIIFGSAKKVVAAKKVEKKVKEAKAHPHQKAGKTTKKESGVKRVTNIDTVVGLVQASTEGISMAELKEKTGLSERQIWDIVNRAKKKGSIRKMKRGLYGAA